MFQFLSLGKIEKNSSGNSQQINDPHRSLQRGNAACDARASRPLSYLITHKLQPNATHWEPRHTSRDCWYPVYRDVRSE